jgi:hypothetical protein
MGLRHVLPLLSLLLTACGTSLVPQGGAQRPATTFTPATRAQPSGVMGADARSLQKLLGAPRLDIRDPAARKLQFANAQCVLDAYLYPPGINREPIVTHVDARSVAGDEMDWATCAGLLRKR